MLAIGRIAAASTRSAARFASVDAKSAAASFDPLGLLDANKTPTDAEAETPVLDAPVSDLNTMREEATPVSTAAQDAIASLRQRSLLNRFTGILAKNSNVTNTIEEHLVSGLFALQCKTNQNPAVLFEKCISMLSPALECGSYRKGSKLIRVPLPVTDYRGSSYAMRWMRDSLRKRRKPPVAFEDKFVAEVLAVLEGKSPLLQKKAQMHRDALVNRSFAPHRWGVGYKI
jgi:ribosomal protein S7